MSRALNPFLLQVPTDTVFVLKFYVKFFVYVCLEIAAFFHFPFLIISPPVGLMNKIPRVLPGVLEQLYSSDIVSLTYGFLHRELLQIKNVFGYHQAMVFSDNVLNRPGQKYF